MQFVFEGENGYRPLRFIEGPLSRFDGLAMLIGYGDKKNLTRRKLIPLLRRALQFARNNEAKNITIDFKELRALAPKAIADADLAQMTAEAFVMANYEYTAHKTAPKNGFKSVDMVEVKNATPATKAAFEKGRIVGEAVNACRELANTPGGDMTPELLAEAAVAAAQGTPARVKVLGVSEMATLGMGAVLGVAKGSSEAPAFIIVEYWGTDRSKKPTVLVGKGVTFDTGGLNIKTGDGMYEMHMDMSGGAAVIHATILAARLGLKKNVVALVPAVENASASNAFRPGDILKSMSGKTIEILNTDAEGRVILADALTYAKKYNPASVVDVATLTGASLIALGTVASAFMTNKESLIAPLMELAEESGDYMWPLPLWEEYNPMVKGTFADVPNLSTMGSSRHGGVIAGGKFLEVFAKELSCMWVHIDMAPRMTTTPEDCLAKGAAGNPVRFLLKYIESGVK
ncbi:MAG: leucyl aminopeptidase family protein [Candidatus Pacebacteria bacterium]|nr:leucyl aminopeptidase family protein [Candidatus Paceibacterota bacterium]